MLYCNCPDRFAVAADPTTGRDNAREVLSLAELCEVSASEVERGYASKIVLSALFNCGTRLDRLLPDVVKLYGASMRTAHTKYLRSQAGAVLSAALLVNVAGTLAAMEAEGTTAATFDAWCTAVAHQYYRKSPDVKITIISFAHLLQQPLESLPPMLVPMVPNLLSCLASLQVQFENLLRREAELREERGDEDEDDWSVPDFRAQDEGEGGGDEADDMEWDAAKLAESDAVVDAKQRDGVDDDEDYIDPDDVEHKRMLEGGREMKFGVGRSGETVRDGELAEGDEFDGDVPAKVTPLDHMNHYMWVAGALFHLHSQPQAAALQAALDPAVTEALVTMARKADADRERGWTVGAFSPAPADWANPDAPDDEEEEGEEGEGEDGGE